MIYSTIRAVRQQLETEGFPMEIWYTRDIRRICGVDYSQLYRLERRGLIDKLTRGPNGRITAAPREVYIMLLLIEAHILGEYNRKGIICKI